MNNKIILLRIVHGLFAVYFLFCIIYIYYAAFAFRTNSLLLLAVLSLATEGALVFILNHGNCPLIYLHKKLGDPVPFFNLFLPEPLAKKAIPFFTIITFIGVILWGLRVLI